MNYLNYLDFLEVFGFFEPSNCVSFFLVADCKVVLVSLILSIFSMKITLNYLIEFCLKDCNEILNSEEGQQLDINTSLLSDGVYILSLHSGESVSNKKFSVSH